MDGEFVTAAWVHFGSPDVAEAMVAAGWDVIVIDGEHGIGDVEQWIAIARAVENAGADVILRVPHGQPWLINRVIDRGIRSIIVPRVNTAAQAREIADACRYPPHGNRGYAAAITRSSSFGTRPDYGLVEAHEEVFLMVQCEHFEAVDNIAEMASVKGVDGIFIGPNDLAGSVDRIERLDSPDVVRLLERIEKECRHQGRLLATITGPGRGYGELRALGYGLAVGDSDVGALMRATRSGLEDRDAALGLDSAEIKVTGY
nr:aldolase/citrate lyase family protein [Rhizobium sp. L1K21]